MKKICHYYYIYPSNINILMPFRGHNIANVLSTHKNWLSMHDHVWQRLAHEKLVSFQLHGSSTSGKPPKQLNISQYCTCYQLSTNIIYIHVYIHKGGFLEVMYFCACTQGPPHSIVQGSLARLFGSTATEVA